MNFDEMQSAWQSADHGGTLKVPEDILLKEVRRHQRSLEWILLRRDTGEILVAGFLFFAFLSMGLRKNDWTWILGAVMCAGVGSFLLADRLWQRQKQPKRDDSLRSCIQASLNRVNHQIWLLNNVLWWYLLPIIIGWSAIVGRRAWEKRAMMMTLNAIPSLIYIVFGIAVFYGVYWLNLRAVRKQLIPRREELEALLTSLSQQDC